jgi:hypothetical protein
MWSLDGTAPGPGPILTPDLEASDGTLTPPPGAEYALAINGVELQAPLVARRRDDRLYRLDGRPLQLAAAITGRQSDGWLVGSSEEKVARGAYTRYGVNPRDPNWVVVKLSRRGWCPDPPGGTTATVRIGTVDIGEDRQPAMGRVLVEETKPLQDCTDEGFAFVRPDVPWRVEIEVSPTVRPIDVDPSSSERRELGATLSVEQLEFRP